MALTASADENGALTSTFWLPDHVETEICEMGSRSDTPTVLILTLTDPAWDERTVDPPFPCNRSPEILPACVEISMFNVLVLAAGDRDALLKNPPPVANLTLTLPARVERRSVAGFSPSCTSTLILMLPLVVERSKRSYNSYDPEIERYVSCSRCSRLGKGGHDGVAGSGETTGYCDRSFCLLLSATV